MGEAMDQVKSWGEVKPGTVKPFNGDAILVTAVQELIELMEDISARLPYKRFYRKETSFAPTETDVCPHCGHIQGNVNNREYLMQLRPDQRSKHACSECGFDASVVY